MTKIFMTQATESKKNKARIITIASIIAAAIAGLVYTVVIQINSIGS